MDYLQRAKTFRTKKRLGQNFLVNPEIIDFIIKSSNLTKEDTVIEIGAGAGFVTEQLVKEAGHVYAIELDEEAIKILNKIKADNLTIIHKDILKTDISEIANGEKVKIVANIPYYITAPIISHLLGEFDDVNNKNRNSISEITIMVQKEVAQRIIANEKSPSKQYGLLTFLSQFWADCEIIKNVGRKCFYPAPKVESAIVKMVVRKEPIIKSEDLTHLRRIVRAAFSMRRKNIKNCLLSAGFSKESITKALNTLNIDENTRGEKISIETFADLSKEIKNNAQG